MSVIGKGTKARNRRDNGKACFSHQVRVKQAIHPNSKRAIGEPSCGRAAIVTQQLRQSSRLHTPCRTCDTSFAGTAVGGRARHVALCEPSCTQSLLRVIQQMHVSAKFCLDLPSIHILCLSVACRIERGATKKGAPQHDDCIFCNENACTMVWTRQWRA